MSEAYTLTTIVNPYGQGVSYIKIIKFDSNLYTQKAFDLTLGNYDALVCRDMFHNCSVEVITPDIDVSEVSSAFLSGQDIEILLDGTQKYFLFHSLDKVVYQLSLIGATDKYQQYIYDKFNESYVNNLDFILLEDNNYKNFNSMFIDINSSEGSLLFGACPFCYCNYDSNMLNIFYSNADKEASEIIGDAIIIRD